MIEILAYLNATASIRILAWFDDPEALSQLGRAVQYWDWLSILSIMEDLLELEELRIVEALLDVECERQMAVILESYCLVVHLHIVVYCLFVAQVVIIFHFAIRYRAMRGHILLLLLLLLFGFLSSTNDFAGLGRTIVRRR